MVNMFCNHSLFSLRYAIPIYRRDNNLSEKLSFIYCVLNNGIMCTVLCYVSCSAVINEKEDNHVHVPTIERKNHQHRNNCINNVSG